MHPAECRVEALAGDGYPHIPMVSSNGDVAALVTLATSPKGGRSCQLPKALGACLLTQRADKPQGNSEADRCGVHQTFSAGRQRQLWSPHAPLN